MIVGTEFLILAKAALTPYTPRTFPMTNDNIQNWKIRVWVKKMY